MARRRPGSGVGAGARGAQGGLLVLAGVASIAGCMPPPARVVDEWLAGFAAGDSQRVLAATRPEDRELLGAALAELEHTPTGTLAMSLPPRPVSHELVEVESKDDARGRWVIATKMTLKNPLPYVSKRVGQLLDDIPKTREQRRRFLVVRTGTEWGVQLDLARVRERFLYASRFASLLDREAYAEAEAMLAELPPPPDEANALAKTDRLGEVLALELAKAKKATGQGAAPPVGSP